MAIGGEWMFSFFLVSLFFGLLCRAGFPIVRHTGVKIVLRGHSNQKKKERKKVSKCMLMGSLTISENLNKHKAAWWIGEAYTWSMGSVVFLYIVKKWNICFYLNFSFFYLSASQPRIITQGSDELQEGGGHNIQYLHTFFREQWGFAFFKTVLKNHLNCFVLLWSVSFFLWCWPVQFRRTHLSPVGSAVSSC